MKRALWLGLLGTFAIGTAHAATEKVAINLVSADGAPQAIGSVTISETAYGLLFTPDLKSLPAGVHGFHVHENASCEAGMKDGVKGAALAAGGAEPKPANDMGFMYTRMIEDPDGNVLEAFWMDPAAAAG